jgi:hypothetical protein
MVNSLWRMEHQQSNWECPFCHRPSTIGDPDGDTTFVRLEPASVAGEEVLTITQVVCPSPTCHERYILAELYRVKLDAAGRVDWDLQTKTPKIEKEAVHSWRLRPTSRARTWPAAVPEALRNDYVEACLIETLSPKASATLARRCLQQITRGYFKVKSGRLFDELGDVQKAGIDATLFRAIDSLRQIGNLGAHPEKDVDHIVDVEPGEAAASIRLIELLIDATYIKDAENAAILAEVTASAARIEAARKAKPSGP